MKTIVKTIVKSFIPTTIVILTLTACSGGGSGATTVSTAPASTAPATTAPGVTTPAPAPTPTPAPTHPNVGVTVPVGPIVLVHGVDPLSFYTGMNGHFIGVEDELRSRGATIINPMQSGINAIDVRARQLKASILAAYPDPTVKVNLVAHSMGGLDARYMITHLGMADRVASLSTISTPHQGTPLADIALGVLPGPIVTVLDTLMNFVGWDMDVAIHTSEDYVQNTFNPTTPNDPGVFYQSWAGRSDPFGSNGVQLRQMLIPTWTILAGRAGPNDGIIPVSSAPWGLYRGELGADHFGEIGLAQPGFDHTQFYVDVAADLAQRGF